MYGGSVARIARSTSNNGLSHLARLIWVSSRLPHAPPARRPVWSSPCRLMYSRSTSCLQPCLDTQQLGKSQHPWSFALKVLKGQSFELLKIQAFVSRRSSRLLLMGIKAGLQGRTCRWSILSGHHVPIGAESCCGVGHTTSSVSNLCLL